jgi:hypothetical protein
MRIQTERRKVLHILEYELEETAMSGVISSIIAVPMQTTGHAPVSTTWLIMKRRRGQ